MSKPIQIAGVDKALIVLLDDGAIWEMLKGRWKQLLVGIDEIESIEETQIMREGKG